MEGYNTSIALLMNRNKHLQFDSGKISKCL
jgi:hypothetical protein